MADTDGFKTGKKVSVKDESDTEPSTAPEFKGAGTKLNDEVKEPHVDTGGTDDAEDEADPATDAAVDDIMKKDSDEVLKTQDEKGSAGNVKPQGRFKRFMAGWWGNPRARWITIGAVVVVLAAVGGVPYTRYTVAGLVLKGKVTVQAVDSKTGQPVSGAVVSLGGKTAETDASGKATLQVNAGSKKLVVSKQYYTGVTQKELVSFSGNTYQVKLVALGHQVNIKVVNKLTGNAVANAVVAVKGGNTKTKADGTATVVIPSDATVQDATVSLSGYNTSNVSIFAAGDLAKNTFGITPAGKLYFLSNLSGKLDVVKTDLDGSNRQTVIAGTGNEDKSNTSLLASRDWKYLALLSKRTGDNASIFLIDTTNGDSLTTIDEGNANFSLVGWSGDKFIYTVDRNTVQGWQPNKQALKSFDATTGHTLLLDQTQGAGTSNQDYQHQTLFLPYLTGDQVVYGKNWEGWGNNPLNGKTAELDSIGTDGSGHKVIKTFAPDTYSSNYGYASISIDIRVYEPGALYISFWNNSNQESFYTYEDDKVTDNADLTNEKFYSTAYPTHLLSPSGSSTFWAEPRDGKNTLFTGDVDGKAPKQVASLSDYNTYGWYTDNYLLVSKNSSELYIMPTSGGTPYKITDYYKPSVSYYGYGGGYGGL